MQLPKVVLRDLTLDDVEDRFHCWIAKSPPI